MKRKEILAQAKEYQSSPAGRVFSKLLQVWIAELREKNDMSDPDETLRNQGAIRELKLIQKGTGFSPVIREFDGGFGD